VGKKKQEGRPEVAERRQEPSGVTNPLAQVEDGLLENHQRNSSDLIYHTVMRGGGEPFGAPFERGVSSLTEAVVKLFRQRGFFAFETLEKPRRSAQPNKFTRYGASTFRGSYRGRDKKDS
jgi:hypothetical protein